MNRYRSEKLKDILIKGEKGFSVLTSVQQRKELYVLWGKWCSLKRYTEHPEIDITNMNNILITTDTVSLYNELSLSKIELDMFFSNFMKRQRLQKIIIRHREKSI